MAYVTAKFYLHILPPFSSKLRSNKDSLISKGTYNPVTSCQLYPAPKPASLIKKYTVTDNQNIALNIHVA